MILKKDPRKRDLFLFAHISRAVYAYRMNDELPPNAKLAFKGNLFEVWQWEQKMFDGTTHTFEKIKRPDSADVIAIVGDKIIVERQEQPHRAPFTSIPGGRCDEGEDPLVGAKRELLEETGYVSDDWSAFRQRRPFNSLMWTSYTFIARDCKRIAEPHLDAGERISMELVTFEEFIALSQKPEFRDREFGSYLLRTLFDPEFKEELRKKFFNS
jgi:ADP-ribose pyrophosphatase